MENFAIYPLTYYFHPSNIYSLNKWLFTIRQKFTSTQYCGIYTSYGSNNCTKIENFGVH